MKVHSRILNKKVANLELRIYTFLNRQLRNVLLAEIKAEK